VAREAGTGEIVAVQRKFYSPDAVLSWHHVSTLVAMLSQAEFASALFVSTAGAESSNLHSNLDLNSKPIDLWWVEDFEESLVDWDQFDMSGRAS
jgi:predicted helicase